MIIHQGMLTRPRIWGVFYFNSIIIVCAVYECANKHTAVPCNGQKTPLRNWLSVPLCGLMIELRSLGLEACALTH